LSISCSRRIGAINFPQLARNDGASPYMVCEAREDEEIGNESTVHAIFASDAAFSGAGAHAARGTYAIDVRDMMAER
jgi:hypothetical protein